MRFLIAPNAFKGSLSASEAAALIARGVRRACPSAALDLMPVSDGGDGLMEVLLKRHGGRKATRTVTNALGDKIQASYALLGSGGTAVVEMAQASGIAGLPRKRLNALRATSYGTGELILDALKRGCKTLLIGMGGSASSDGGAGMAAALGAKLLDSQGEDLPLGAEPLTRLDRIELGGLLRLRGSAKVLALSDVTNPLLGPKGSARVFGPQKGATPAQVRVLEKALGRYSRVLERDLGASVAGKPGSGAAGGLGAGLAAFLRAELLPGADWVLNDLEASGRLSSADCVITGEGKVDSQSFFGKAPLALAERAAKAGVPVLLIGGQLEKNIERRLSNSGVVHSAGLMRARENLPSALRATKTRLVDAAAELVKAFLKQPA